MPSNLIHMALDSIIEGETLDTVVNRILLVERQMSQRSAECDTHYNYGSDGTGFSALKNALRRQKPKTINENKGGTGSITTNDGASISSDACSPDDKTVRKEVVRRSATNTSYPDECTLIYPPPTLESNTQHDEGVSTLVEYNFAADYFVYLAFNKIPDDIVTDLTRARTISLAMMDIFLRIKHLDSSAELQDIDTSNKAERSLLAQVKDAKAASNALKMLKAFLRPIKGYKKGSVTLEGLGISKFGSKTVWHEKAAL